MHPAINIRCKSPGAERPERDLWLIRVDPGGPFSFKAGQYATLALITAEKELSARIHRFFSVRRRAGILCRAVPQGELTPHLYNASGRHLLCRKNFQGRFTLDLKAEGTINLCSPR